MKIITTATIIGKNRESFPPGSEIDLPRSDAESLITRGFAVLPQAAVGKAKKIGSDDDNQEDTGGGDQSDTSDEDPV